MKNVTLLILLALFFLFVIICLILGFIIFRQKKVTQKQENSFDDFFLEDICKKNYQIPTEQKKSSLPREEELIPSPKIKPDKLFLTYDRSVIVKCVNNFPKKKRTQLEYFLGIMRLKKTLLEMESLYKIKPDDVIETYNQLLMRLEQRKQKSI
jgi:hypothetical protein